MHDELHPPHGPDPIALSREPDIDLGMVVIRPSAREVHFAENVLTLEPRVMQVLVVLARSPGTVVSRETLVDLCWEGRIVGDDAITRCIGALRKLAISCGSTFAILTLPKIGYRLVVKPVPPDHRAGAEIQESAETPHESYSEASRPGATFGSIPRQVRPSLKWVAVGIAATSVALVIAWLGLGDGDLPPARSSAWTVADVRTVASSPMAEREPTLSPDGQLIAFSRGATHHREIFVQGLKSSEPLQITSDEQIVGRGIDKSAPAWSPDGSQIAYLLRPDDKPCRIVVQPFPKGAARDVGGCVGPTKGRLVWLPTGDSLIFVDRLKPGGPFSLMMLDLTRGSSTQISDPPAGDGDFGAVASPDGRSLAFIRSENHKPVALNLLNLRTKSLRVLRTGADFLTGAWSDDSKTLFFAEKDSHGRLCLMAMSVADGLTDEIYLFPNTNMRGPMSGRQGLVALTFERAHYELGYAPKTEPGVTDIIRVNEDHVFTPSFSPQGVLAFGVFRGDKVSIQTREPGQAAQELAIVPGGLEDLSWSCDGNVLATGLVFNSGAQVRLIDWRDQSIRTIDLGGHSVGQMGWMSNGRLLVPVQTNHWHLLTIDAETGTATPAGFSDSNWDSVQIQGGKVFATRQGVSGLWRLDGVERQVSSVPPFQIRNSAVRRHWRIAGNDVVFARFDTQSLIAQPLNGGPQRAIAHLPGMSDSLAFDIDPKTQRVMYQLGSSDTDIMLIHLQRSDPLTMAQ